MQYYIILYCAVRSSAPPSRPRRRWASALRLLFVVCLICCFMFLFMLFVGCIMVCMCLIVLVVVYLALHLLGGAGPLLHLEPARGAAVGRQSPHACHLHDLLVPLPRESIRGQHLRREITQRTRTARDKSQENTAPPLLFGIYSLKLPLRSLRPLLTPDRGATEAMYGLTGVPKNSLSKNMSQINKKLRWHHQYWPRLSHSDCRSTEAM